MTIFKTAALASTSSRTSRVFRASVLALSATIGVLGAVACGSDDAPTSQADAVQGFKGTLLANTGEQGVFEVRVAQASTRGLSWQAGESRTLSGSVSFGPSLTANVTGTYDEATGAVNITGTATISGVPVTINATFAGGRLTGTFTAGSFTGTLAAYGIGVDPVLVYCGATVGRTGSINFATSGNLAGGAVAFTGESTKVFGAIKTGATFTATYPTGGTINATVAGDTITGSFADGAGNGTFSASSGACPTLADVFSDAGMVEDGGPASDAPNNPDSPNTPDTSPPIDAGTNTALTTVPGTSSGTIAISTDYIAVSANNEIRFVKKDGTGAGATTSACTNGCTSVGAIGNTFYFTDGINQLKSVTPPSTTVSSAITTVSANHLIAVSDSTNLYLTRGFATGGILRLNPANLGSTISNSGIDIRGVRVNGGSLFFTRAGGTAILQSMTTDLGAPQNLVLTTEVGAATLPGGLVTAGADTFFLTQNIAVTTEHKLWVQSGAGTAALVATVPTIGSLSQNPILSATHVYLLQLTQSGDLNVVRYARSDRNATTPQIVIAGEGREVVADATKFYYKRINGANTDIVAAAIP